MLIICVTHCETYPVISNNVWPKVFLKTTFIIYHKSFSSLLITWIAYHSESKFLFYLTESFHSKIQWGVLSFMNYIHARLPKESKKQRLNFFMFCQSCNEIHSSLAIFQMNPLTKIYKCRLRWTLMKQLVSICWLTTSTCITSQQLHHNKWIQVAS